LYVLTPLVLPEHVLKCHHKNCNYAAKTNLLFLLQFVRSGYHFSATSLCTVGVKLHPFLTSTLDEGEFVSFTERSPFPTVLNVCWVDPTAVLDLVANKHPTSSQKSNPVFPDLFPTGQLIQLLLTEFF